MPKDIVIIPASGQIEFSGSSTHHNVLTVDSSSVRLEAEEFRIVGGNIVAENFVVSSSVTHLTSSAMSGSTIFGDTPADDTHQFTGSMFITGSGNPSLTVDGKIALRSGTPGNQQISFGNTDQFIQGHDNYLIIDGDDQVVVKADTKINIDSPVVGIGGFTTNSTPTATLHISGAGDTRLNVEGNISASGNISSSGQVYGNIVNVNTRVKAIGSSLEFAGNELNFVDGGSTGYLFRGIVNGAFEAYHSANKKLETTADGIITTGDMSASGDLFIGQISSSGTGNNFLNGNLRISDAIYNPTHLLHLSGSNVDGEMIKVGGSKTRGGTIRYERGGSYTWRAGVGGASSTNSNIPTSFFGIEDASDSNTVAIAIAHSTQNVGINNTSPSAQLDVNGNLQVQSHITASGNISSSGTGTNFFAGNIDFDGDTTIGTVGASDDISINPDGELNLGTGGADEINIGRTSGTADINMFANTSTPAARFVTSTITFNHPISASGDISASGTIISNDITADAVTGVSSILNTGLVIGRDSDNQIDFGTDNVMIFKINNASELRLNATSLRPHTNNGLALGSTTTSWSDLYLAEGGFITFDNGDVVITQTGPEIELSGSGATSFNVEGNVTASGNISSSGTITGNAINVNGTNVLVAGGVDISDDTNLTGGTGITLTGDTLSTTDGEIVHDNLSGFVANEHIDHSGVSITAGAGLNGGGTIASTRTLSVDSASMGGFYSASMNNFTTTGTLTVAGATTLGSATSDVHRITGSIEATGSGDLLALYGEQTIHNPNGNAINNVLTINSTNTGTNTNKFSFNLNGSEFMSVASSNGNNFTSLTLGADMSAASGFEGIAIDSLARLNFGDAANTFIEIDTNTPEDLRLAADDDIVLMPDDDLIIQAGSTTHTTFFGEGKARIGSTSTSAPTSILEVGGDVTATHITASGNISASGDVKGSTLTGTLSTAAQGNITSLGTLTTLTVDDITINGSTISDGADFTLDVEGDITLDANGADIILSDDGTDFGRFKRDSSDFIIKSETNNKDIVFRGQDGGATITALTLDMSEAGSATFNNHITASGNISASGQLIAASANFNDGDITNVGKISVDEVKCDVTDDVNISLTTSGIDFTADDSDTFMFNGENNVDFIVKNSSGHELFIDGDTNSSTTRVGIGFNGGFASDNLPPVDGLTVHGNISASGFLQTDSYIQTDSHITASGNISSSGTITSLNSTIVGTATIGTYKASTNGGAIQGSNGEDYIQLSANNLLEMGDPSGAANGTVLKVDDNNSKITLSSPVSIGTETPATNMELTVAGDISASGTLNGGAITATDPTITYASASIVGLANGEGYGEIIELFPAHPSTVAGDVVFHLGSVGTVWRTGANSSAYTVNMAGVALEAGDGSTPCKVLTKGVVRLAAGHIQDTSGTDGQPLYTGDTAGHVQFAAPSDSGDLVRILGYCLVEDDDIIYFNPDNTFVEIA